MSLLSALEDFRVNTLTAIQGGLRKLEYLSGLRDRDGYLHWGLGRVHGEERAKRALADAHRSLLSQILSTPIHKLEEDARKSSQEAGMQEGEYLEGLSSSSARLLPPVPGAGSSRHLSSVLYALSSLRKHRKSDANPPA